MSYCINPWCSNRQNEQDAQVCANCGTELLLDNRFRVIRAIDVRQFHPFDTFEAIDYVGTPIRKKNTSVILKTLKGDVENYLDIFEKEFNALKILRHPGIPKSDPDDFFLKTLGRDSSHQVYCLIMSKFEGVTLSDWIQNHGRVSQERLINWMGQIAEILDYMHNQSYFHRDIKPDNIIVQPNDRLALIDYGGVKKITQSYITRLSQLGRREDTQLYSLLYSAPEQFEGRATPQSDFYSLGRTFIFASTGKELNTLPINRKTNELLWLKNAPQLDLPTKRFLQRLTNVAPSKRPLYSAELVNIVFDSLPKQLKWYRILRSKPFQVFSLITVILLIFIIIVAGRYALALNFYNIGKSQIQGGDFSKAIQSFKQSILIQPNEDAYFSLGDACNQIKNIQCAKDNFNKVVRLNPKNSAAYFNIALLYDNEIYKGNKIQRINLPNYNLAIDAYKQAVKVSKGNPIYVNNLARLYIIGGYYKEAKNLIQPLLKKSSNSLSSYTLALLYKNLGWAEFKLNKRNEAKKLLEMSANLKQPLAAPYCLLVFLRDNNVNRDKCFDVNAEDAALPEVQKWRRNLYSQH